ncbi:hypothetical protein V4C85_25130 [Ralstonia solanacearum]|uniref:hypothetical protein n=1 Tax=Ralstonia solanacearum TaxID=305 RepID=UPI0007C8CA89|nr:hypothetical protein [Ralstonia solanacearum]OAI62593.1 hypothetical protein RSP597_21775 [Ralstonia solanacearum]RCW07714.1 hypothetical protein RSP816_17305 [Ralstonia solanacearum]
MSFSLDLEVDSRVDRDCVLGILRQMQFEVSEERDDCVRGNFPESNMFAVFKLVTDEREMAPRTEGADFARGWRIGVRANFYYVMSNFDKCGREMREFLSRINGGADAYFLFYFQMEKIYAIKDRDGMRIVEEF